MNNRYTQSKTKLRKGEYQRKNRTFEYRWIDKNGKRQYVYAKSLPELRKKEDAILRDTLEGIDYSKLDLTINYYFELWKKIKTGIRETTYATYVSFYERYIEPDFGKTKLKNVTEDLRRSSQCHRTEDLRILFSQARSLSSILPSLYCNVVDRNACRRSAWTKVGRYRLRE